jgi:hypothetical protein
MCKIEKILHRENVFSIERATSPVAEVLAIKGDGEHQGHTRLEAVKSKKRVIMPVSATS